MVELLDGDKILDAQLSVLHTPPVARQTRRRLLDRLEAEAVWLAPSHFPEPFGTVTRDPDGRHWTGRR